MQRVKIFVEIFCERLKIHEIGKMKDLRKFSTKWYDSPSEWSASSWIR